MRPSPNLKTRGRAGLAGEPANTLAMTALGEIPAWRGCAVHDAAGRCVGVIAGLAAEAGRRPEWALVESGPRLTAVPLERLRHGARAMVLEVPGVVLAGAPAAVLLDGAMPAAVATRLRRHFARPLAHARAS